MNTLPETPLIRDGITFTKFWTGTEVTDIRKLKQYTRRFALHANFVQEVDDTFNTPFPDLHKALSVAFSNSPVPVECFVTGGWGKHSVTVLFLLHADKPSKVVAEKEAWEVVPWTQMEVALDIVHACCASLAVWKEEKALEERVVQANHLLGWTIKTFNKRAKAHTFYEERLEKLKEEYAEGDSREASRIRCACGESRVRSCWTVRGPTGGSFRHVPTYHFEERGALMNRRQRKKLFTQSRTIWKNKYRPIWRNLWKEFASTGRKQWHKKLLWVSTIYVGSEVNDCRFRNLKVAEVWEMPYDLDLVLEDGSHCSASSCCSPPMTKEEIASGLRERGASEEKIAAVLEQSSPP